MGAASIGGGRKVKGDVAMAPGTPAENGEGEPRTSSEKVGDGGMFTLPRRLERWEWGSVGESLGLRPGTRGPAPWRWTGAMGKGARPDGGDGRMRGDVAALEFGETWAEALVARGGRGPLPTTTDENMRVPDQGAGTKGESIGCSVSMSKTEASGARREPGDDEWKNSAWLAGSTAGGMGGRWAMSWAMAGTKPMRSPVTPRMAMS
jgi:hypothetical protein